MTREKAISITEKVKKALLEIEKEENITFDFQSLSFTSVSMKMSLSANDGDKSDDINHQLCKKYGFSQNIIGMEFTSTSGSFTIDSFKTRNRKYPIIATRKSDGRQYKFQVKSVLKYLGGHSIVNRNANLKELLD
jgi:hypothetical protein